MSLQFQLVCLRNYCRGCSCKEIKKKSHFNFKLGSIYQVCIRKLSCTSCILLHRVLQRRLTPIKTTSYDDCTHFSDKTYLKKLEWDTFSQLVEWLADGTGLLGGTPVLPPRLHRQLTLLGVDEVCHGVFGCPVHDALPVHDEDDGHIVIVHRHQTLLVK